MRRFRRNVVTSKKSRQSWTRQFKTWQTKTTTWNSWKNLYSPKPQYKWLNLHKSKFKRLPKRNSLIYLRVSSMTLQLRSKASNRLWLTSLPIRKCKKREFKSLRTSKNNSKRKSLSQKAKFKSVLATKSNNSCFKRRFKSVRRRSHLWLSNLKRLLKSTITPLSNTKVSKCKSVPWRNSQSVWRSRIRHMKQRSQTWGQA